MKKLLHFRRICQIFILLLFILVPVLNLYEIYVLKGNLLAFSFFGIPLIDPFSGFQAILGILRNSLASQDFFFSLVPSDIWLGMGLIFILALLCGTVFCSWLCPYGFFSELVWKIANKESKDKVIDDKNLYYNKYIFFLFLCLIVFIFKTGPIGNLLSMPAWYTKIWQYIFLYSSFLFLPFLFILSVLALEYYLKRRIYCLYICPQSVLISLVAKFSPYRLRLNFTAKSCTCLKENRACVQACSLNLNPRMLKNKEILCTNCAECVKACEKVCTMNKKALNLKFKNK